MNLRMSVARLPDSIRELILTERTIKMRYERGEILENILASGEWAQEWKMRADSSCVAVLNGIVARFAAEPFELDSLIKSFGETSSLTGAEIRIAVARLRRSGIVFAVRKAWGDRLFYLPVDCVPVWQRLMLPVESTPLAEEEMKEIVFPPKPFRLPLSLELLSAWQAVSLQPIEWTTKGALNKVSVNKMTGAMRINEEEIAVLSLSYPHKDQLPAHAALALDLGLYAKVLCKEGNVIRVSDQGLSEWLIFSPEEADSQLHSWVVERYGAANPAHHLAAAAIDSLNEMEWHQVEAIGSRIGHQGAICDWLGLMESFGWVERGICRENAVFRKKVSHRRRENPIAQGDGAFFVQPDGEIFVPPETELRARWVLAEIAEKVTEDSVFVYRLTRNACSKAMNAGYALKSVQAFLEEGSSLPLPDPVLRSLQDWFLPLGKAAFSEVMLLRTSSPELASILKQDPNTAEKLIEQLGDRDFIVDAASYPFLRLRLQKLGYPPLESKRDATAMKKEEPDANSQENMQEDQGWVYRRHVLSVFEPDRAVPSMDELFPGLSSIPASWVSKPRTYHASTSKQLLQRAIEWQASVRLESDGSSRTFIPEELKDDSGEWSVVGHWRGLSARDDEPGIGKKMAVVHPEEITKLMIWLPLLEELETN
ncbi:helicase-associated domain-containing protein [Cohnella luojiensis]|uniref:Helicase XPB/Ssl2 N-terminal domain-containing protein n=1 Tax=Cohnella luojiensis TaxID=652876 RepID=A0A4Y8M8D0_9BACL|nr:helicase-associated domain-containing protein [Cohnella luojiensis]TFE31824.1 hypothetical protein E2980_01785 [Cohnella luojiensis]